jgi:predicted RNA binding protein YcfA (HicA-like mRNA interferase family)
MPKIPRNISGRDLAKLLSQYGYQFDRQAGSHFSLKSNYKGFEHRITIPDHNFIKIGTLDNILSDVANYLGIYKRELKEKLF